MSDIQCAFSSPASWLSRCQIRGVSALSLLQDRRKWFVCGENSFTLGGDYTFLSKHWNCSLWPVMSRVCACVCVCVCTVHVCLYMTSPSALCKSNGSAQASSIIVPYSIAFISHMSSVFSVCSWGVACPYTYWLTLALGAFGNPPR